MFYKYEQTIYFYLKLLDNRYISKQMWACGLWMFWKQDFPMMLGTKIVYQISAWYKAEQAYLLMSY